MSSITPMIGVSGDRRIGKDRPMTGRVSIHWPLETARVQDECVVFVRRQSKRPPPLDDGRGVVLSLLRTREGSNILSEAYFFICLLLFHVISTSTNIGFSNSICFHFK